MVCIQQYELEGVVITYAGTKMYYLRSNEYNADTPIHSSLDHFSNVA